MSEKSEELIEKANNTSNTVSKRTIKLPTSVAEKKKDVNSKPINNIIPIESLKEKSSSSKKQKRTLHLNLGGEPEEVKTESSNDENSITMLIPKTLDIRDDKAKLLDTLLDIDDNSPAITPSTVTSNKSFLDEPSVFEKFDININNKITSTPAQQNSEPTINLNSSFFYEPSIFEKYSIEISETDSDTTIVESQKSENIVEEQNIEENLTEEIEEEPIVNQNVLDSSSSLSLNDLISLDDETESIDDILNTSVKSNDIENIQEESIIDEDIDVTKILNDIDLLIDEDDSSIMDEIINDEITINEDVENIDSIVVVEENQIDNEILEETVIENEEASIVEEEISENNDIIENESIAEEEIEDLDALISQEQEYEVIFEKLESSNDLTSQDDIDLVNEILNEDIGDIIEEDNLENLITSNDVNLINELSNESNDYNLLDLVDEDDSLLKEAADGIKTPETNTNSTPVGIFIENSGVQKNNDTSLFSKAKSSIVSNITSVFKKFSYDEAANLANSIDDDEVDETPIQNVNTVSDIKQILGNVEADSQEKSVTELDVMADSIGVITPTIDENILDISSTETEMNSLNILTPETSTSDFSDDELLDLLELDTFKDESLIDSSDIIEGNIENDEITELLETDLNDDELLDLLDEQENNEQNDSVGNELNLENDDDFSIEDYFGIENVEDSNIVEEEENYEEEFEENIDDLLDDDADIEFDEELSNVQEPKVEETQSKMSGEELLSLSKLFDNLTNTISSLSNRISELENTKMQPVIEPEAIKQAIEQIAKPVEIQNTKIEEPTVEENNVIEEDIVENNIEDSNTDTIIEDSIEENIIEEEIEKSILEDNIEDISLDDIDLEDLSGLTISDVLNETNIEETIDEVDVIEPEENVTSDINMEDINLDDIDLNDIDLEDISLDETEVSNKQDESSIEDHLTTALSSDKNLDTQKEELLLELLSSTDATEEASDANEEPTSDFIKIIDSLSKAISELEQNSLENPIIPENSDEKPVSSKDLGIDSNKAFNILINKDDIFSISILNETYEIIADFDGISVLSENIHISTPKKNFFLKVGNKNIEIHNYKKYFLVYTTFEDVEFANAINNVTFAKKNGRIELNIKEAFKLSSTNNVLELSMLNTSIAKIPAVTQNTSEPTIDDNSSVCDNKTLVISEETQKVYLPYTMADVMEKLNNTANGYQTIEEVVEKEYVVPLSEFKMPIISRFKEAYRFMRVKEKSSVYEALDLALELMFNSNLNPAIIRAAKDLKELDIYLDCLYENELDKFDRFKIIYKVLPKVQN